MSNKTRFKSLDKLGQDERVKEIWSESKYPHLTGAKAQRTYFVHLKAPYQVTFGRYKHGTSVFHAKTIKGIYDLVGQIKHYAIV